MTDEKGGFYMNCYVCNEDMGNMKVCPRCQFRMILPSGDESDSDKKKRADQFRTDLLNALTVSIITYEWDVDETNGALKIKNESSISYPQPGGPDPEKIYWMNEAFAAAKGEKDIDLQIRIRKSLSSDAYDEENVKVTIRTDWTEPVWKTGIRITPGGDLVLVLGDPEKRIIEKEIFNVFMFCE